MELERLGWNNFFKENFRDYAPKGYSVGRVYLESRRSFWLYTENGELRADMSGRMLFNADSRADFPAVGDWVVFRIREDAGRAVIDAVLPRTSKFSRKVPGSSVKEQVVAANIDTVMLISGLDNDFNLRRIERYLVMIAASGADAVVVLNKTDLCSDFESKVSEVEKIAPNVPVVSISAANDSHLSVLGKYLEKGETVALIGSSGVGKSTITNQLLGYGKQRVKEVRASDDRGQHTTTKRELIILPNGGLIMDTPGMRELQLWVSEAGLENSFEDIKALSVQCFYPNCEHNNTQGCAIEQAIADGTLETERWKNYNKLLAELTLLSEKQVKIGVSTKNKVKNNLRHPRKSRYR